MEHLINDYELGNYRNNFHVTNNYFFNLARRTMIMLSNVAYA